MNTEIEKPLAELFSDSSITAPSRFNLTREQHPIRKILYHDDLHCLRNRTICWIYRKGKRQKGNSPEIKSFGATYTIGLANEGVWLPTYDHIIR